MEILALTGGPRRHCADDAKSRHPDPSAWMMSPRFVK